MLSMTGFGRGESTFADAYTIKVEISSVNRKQLEIRCALPPELSALEPAARKAVSALISRGSIMLRATVTPAVGRASGLAVDEDALNTLVAAARKARQKAGLSGEVAVETLMQIPGVIQSAAVRNGETEFASAFEAALAEAGENFQAMRAAEGTALREDLLRRTALLEGFVAKLEEAVKGYPETAKARLQEKISAAKLEVPADDPSLLKEILFYTDRSDVTEELTRLHSHFCQLHRFLDANEPAGRSLDFLAQEFFREITTLGNKAAGPVVSPISVAFKSEMEKMREQIQNVE